MRDLQEKIVKRRSELGLSLQAVGDRAGVSYQAVFKIERGLGGSLETFASVARALGIRKREVLSAAFADVRTKLAQVA